MPCLSFIIIVAVGSLLYCPCCSRSIINIDISSLHHPIQPLVLPPTTLPPSLTTTSSRLYDRFSLSLSFLSSVDFYIIYLFFPFLISSSHLVLWSAVSHQPLPTSPPYTTPNPPHLAPHATYLWDPRWPWISLEGSLPFYRLSSPSTSLRTRTRPLLFFDDRHNPLVRFKNKIPLVLLPATSTSSYAFSRTFFAARTPPNLSPGAGSSSVDNVSDTFATISTSTTNTTFYSPSSIYL